MGVAITGVAMVTPWGSGLDGQLEALRSGRSAVTNWDFGYSKVGAPLPADAADRGLADLGERLGEAAARKLGRLLRGASFSARVGVTAAVDAMLQAGGGLGQEADSGTGVVVCGHQFQSHHLLDNHQRFQENPELIDPLFGLTGIDTYVGSLVSEILNLNGPCLQVGAACASGNLGLMVALDLIRSGRARRMVVVAPPCEMHAMALQSWVMMNAVAFRSFDADPQGASRPFDPRREGFVPAQCAAAVVLEDSAADRALARLSGASSNSNGNRQTQPSEEKAASLMLAACADAGITFAQLSAINAHATLTPLGDAVEAAAIRGLAGASVPVQATKSMLGHSLSASSLVEAVVSVLQIRASFLHPSINVSPDHGLGIDLVIGEPRPGRLEHILSNAFGFGGLNGAVVISR